MSKKYICVTGGVILCALLAYGLLSYLFTPIYTDVSLSYPAICCRDGAGFEPVTVTFEGQIKDVRATGSSRFIGELTVGSRTAVYEDVDTGLALDLSDQTRLPLVFSDEPAASDATHLLQWGRLSFVVIEEMAAPPDGSDILVSEAVIFAPASSPEEALERLQPLISSEFSSASYLPLFLEDQISGKAK